MSKVVNSIEELIGNTPIIKLNKVVEEDIADVYVKLEWFNPGSSIKDRVALNMIENAEKEGKIKPGDTLIEPTSGNTGIGLAMIGASKGYNIIMVMPENMSIERQKLLKAFGADIILTPAALGMDGAINKAKKLADENNYFMPQQFSNPDNPDIHRKTTALEIIDALGTDIDAFVAAVGTGGTLTGCSEVLKERIPKIEIVAVEPMNSAVLSGEKKGAHKIQGIGAGFIPDVLNTEIIDEIEKITDDEALEMARRVAKEEGILVGISTGASITAAIKVAKKLGKGKKVLTISPSCGERYLSTPLFNNL
ncbi:cysteine synthase A [Abyssisolibacter fermentans]|uniref:cysteine synthase A n=1 Tax=Abyssisolibacter fermentans TaxID=1766203 RepID=UPI000830101D|nr:cysteine synthase A [Abyssisolibacter fermentans]